MEEHPFSLLAGDKNIASMFISKETSASMKTRYFFFFLFLFPTWGEANFNFAFRAQ